MKKLSTLVLCLASLLFSAQAFSANDKFSLKDFSGQPATLEQHIGKGTWKVVMIWASDCHACNQEVEQYIQLHESYKGKHIQLLGISLDGTKKLAGAQNFIKKHDVTFPNLIGEFEVVASMYENLTGGAWIGTPSILVFSPKGELKAAQAGAVPTDIIEQFINNQTVANTGEK